MTSVIRLAILALITLTLACNKRTQDPNEERLVTAYKLIDAQRTDEAIQVLEQELSTMSATSPYFSTYKMALGSAYAHKAGIKVQRFVGLLKIGKLNANFSGSIKISRKGTTSKAESVDNLLRSLIRTITGVARITTFYTAIPTVRTEDERYLVYSLKVMDSIEEHRVLPGDALYRAVIRVIYLKHYLATRILDDNVPVETDLKTCEINFDKIDETLSHLAATGASIFDDLSKGQPKKAKSYQASRANLLRSVSDLTILNTFASVIDDMTLAISKHALVESGMRKLLKCSERSSEPLPSVSSASS